MEMLEVTIDSIRVSLMNQQRIVILREVDAERYLAIWVGVYEAEHLTIALQDVEMSRPLTYDLFKNVIKSLDARIIRVEVVALREETFYGNIIMEVNGQEINIDSRPSDALNLAIRTNVPIFVSQEVMESAGIIPEEDEVQEGEELDEGKIAEESPERLSVFEDFLEKLDLDEEEDEEEEDEGDEED
jgi:bifunctional DNase/RNase